MKIITNVFNNFCFYADINYSNFKETDKEIFLNTIRTSNVYDFFRKKYFNFKNIGYKNVFLTKNLHEYLLKKAKNFISFYLTEDDIFGKNKTFVFINDIIDLFYKIERSGDIYFIFYDFSYILPNYMLNTFVFNIDRFSSILEDHNFILNGRLISNYCFCLYFEKEDDFKNFSMYIGLFFDKDQKEDLFHKQVKINQIYYFNIYNDHKKYIDYIVFFEQKNRKKLKYILKYNQKNIILDKKLIHDHFTE